LDLNQLYLEEQRQLSFEVKIINKTTMWKISINNKKNLENVIPQTLVSPFYLHSNSKGHFGREAMPSMSTFAPVVHWHYVRTNMLVDPEVLTVLDHKGKL
jgi:hypothetical protein